jgi:ABC transport system ATP-binding/permease protein
LTGEQSPDSGVVETGDTIKMGVYDQLGIKIDNPEQTVLEFVLEQVQSKENGSISEAPDDARRLLRRFEVPRQRWNQRISVLSGGERRRLQMLSVICDDINFLIMDEPSVDLDLPTLQALEIYLQEFSGVLLVVSHDRFFADKVTDHLFIFEGNGEIKDFPGSLSEYASTLIELENESIVGQSSGDDDGHPKAAYKEDRAKRNEGRNAARRARKDMDNLEKSIEKLKAKAMNTQEEIDNSSSAGWSVLAALTDELNKINEEIEEKEVVWMDLAEQVEVAEIEV